MYSLKFTFLSCSLLSYFNSIYNWDENVKNLILEIASSGHETLAWSNAYFKRVHATVSRVARCSWLPDVRGINPDAPFLELLVAGRELHSRFVDWRPEDPLGAKVALRSVLRRARARPSQKNLNIDPARFPAYVWRSQRIKVHPVIGNGSGPFGWKIHDWIAVGTQFTRWCERDEGGKRKERLSCKGATDITLIFRPWTDEDTLTIRKERAADAERKIQASLISLSNKLPVKLIAANIITSCMGNTRLSASRERMNEITKIP